MNWQDKAMAATNGTQLGAIVACALGREISGARFHGTASVTSDGYVMCDFERANGEYHMGAFVGSFNDLKKNAVGLANHLKLDAEERKEYSDALVAWLGAADYFNAATKLRQALEAA